MCSVQGCRHASWWPQPKGHNVPRPPAPAPDENCEETKGIALTCKEFLRKVWTLPCLSSALALSHFYSAMTPEPLNPPWARTIDSTTPPRADPH